MRGGEGLAKAIQYSYFSQGDTLILSSFNTGSVSFQLNGSPVTIRQQTSYPFGNTVSLALENLKKPAQLTLKFFAPSWILDPQITINQKPVKFTVQNKFIVVSAKVQQGDKIDYSFTLKSGVEDVANASHTPTGKVRFFYGPLLLGYEGESEITVPKNAEVVKNSDSEFQIKGMNARFSSVYHLMDTKVCSGKYHKQILFEREK